MDRRPVGSAQRAGFVQLHQVLPLVERQHAIIEELRARSGRFVPAQVLVERTGTSTRTIERDVSRLREAGVPIQVARGPGGGYRLDGVVDPKPIRFTPGELAALVASLVAVGPYTSATAKSAFAKLIDALT